jgi:Ca2+-binding RTX toxin-like protein
MDDSGRFFVGWFEGELQWDQYLHFRAYNGDGSPRADEFSTSATYLGLQFLSNFDLSVTPDGNSAAYSIESNHSDSHGYDVFFGRVSSTGVLDLATTHTVPGAAVVSGRITSFADGSFAIAADEVPGGLAWNWEVTTSDFTSFVQRFDAAGNPIGEHILLGATLSEGGAGAMNPTIYRLAGGGFVAAYTQGRTLYAQRFNANGLSDDAGPVDFATLDRDVEVNNEAPQIAISASPAGSMIVSFTAADGDWSTRDAIHTRRLTTDAGAIDKSTLYVLGTRRSDAMSVKPRGASVFANVNSASVKFPLSQFFRLEFEGFNGNDRIYNETSIPSTIRGGSGDDELQGGSGSDLIRGNVGDDDLSGNEGNDTLIGDDGRDLLVGNDGNDQLEGGAGADRLYGYAGNDTFFARDGEIDRIFRLTGRDTVDGDAGDVVK